MSINPQEQASNNQQAIEQKKDDKEYNFAQIRRQLESERQARLQAEEKATILEKKNKEAELAARESYDDDEPYIDTKRLHKELKSFAENMEQKIDQKAEEKARFLLEKEREDNWMRQNGDFYDVMQHAQAFADKDPELAESILNMPDNFERKKLVYRNIKAMGLHRKEEQKSGIQDKIEKNRRHPGYQPSGLPSPGYTGTGGDFSLSGQKTSYEKMKELQSNLRL